MNKLPTKSILAVVSALFVVLAIAGGMLYSMIGTEQAALRTAKETLSASNAEDIVKLKQSVQHLAPQIRQIENYFIDHSNAVGFLEGIERIASEAGLFISIENIEVVDKLRQQTRIIEGETVTEEARVYGELTMSVRTTGSWQGTMAMLATFEQLDKKIMVDGLRLSASTDATTGESAWTAIFNLRGFTD